MKRNLIFLLLLFNSCKIIVTLEGKLEHDLRQYFQESNLKPDLIKSDLPEKTYYIAFAENAGKKYEKEKLIFKLWSKRKLQRKYTLIAGVKIGSSRLEYLIELKPYCQKDYCFKKDHPFCILVLKLGKETLKLKTTCDFDGTVRPFYFKHFGYLYKDQRYFFLGKKGRKTLLQVGTFHQSCYVVKIQSPIWIKKECYLDLECQNGNEKLLLLHPVRHSSCTL